MSESGITVVDGVMTSFHGPDAVNLFRAKTLRSGLRLLKYGIKPARNWTKTKALAMAGEYTGKNYKRGEIDAALADLSVWIATMLAALPVEEVRSDS